jgi:cardiolipin synthase
VVAVIVTWIAVAVLISWVVTALMGVVVIRYRRPERAWAWLAVMFGLPWVGLVLYVLYGGQVLTLRRRRRYSRGRVPGEKKRESAAIEPHIARPDLPSHLMGADRQVLSSGGFPPTGGNQVALSADHEEILERVVADINDAEHHIHMVFYIFSDDEVGRRVTEALTDAASRGVHCRLLLDSVGSRPAFAKLVPAMREKGIEVRSAFPVNPWRSRLQRFDLRNHRKIVIIDGKIVHVGSWNVCCPTLRTPYSGPRFNVMMRAQGPLTLQMQSLFLADWEFEGPPPEEEAELFPHVEAQDGCIAQTLPSDPLVPTAPVRDVAQFLIGRSQRQVTLASPYFVPDEPVELALYLASERGADVNLIVPAHSDLRFVDAATRSYCRSCAEHGVKIHIFQPGFLHAKILLVDDAVAMVGSANFDNRSFRLNLETNAVGYSPQFVLEVKRVLDRYMDQCVKLEEEFGPVRFRQRMYEDLARLFSPLL